MKDSIKKTLKATILTLLLLTLSVSTALLAYLHFFASKDSGLTGEWTTELDMAGEAAVAAYAWLQDMEGVSVSPEEMEAYMEGLTVRVDLNLTQTEGSAGAFTAMCRRKAMSPARRRPIRHWRRLSEIFWHRGFTWRAMRAAWTRRA